MQGGVGIPQVKFYGTEGEFNVMVMEIELVVLRVWVGMGEVGLK